MNSFKKIILMNMLRAAMPGCKRVRADIHSKSMIVERTDNSVGNEPVKGLEYLADVSAVLSFSDLQTVFVDFDKSAIVLVGLDENGKEKQEVI